MTVTNDLLAEVGGLCEQIIAAQPVESDPRTLTTALGEAGLLDPDLLETDDDGAGGRAPATAVITALAAAGVRVPVVEHLWSAHYVLAAASLTAPDGVLTAAAASIDAELTVDRLGETAVLTGTVPDVSAVDVADHLVVLTQDGTVAVIPTAALSLSDTRSLGAMTWSTVSLTGVRVPSGALGRASLVPADLERRTVSGRLLQISAAAGRATRLTAAHVASRVQFGRPLGRFQAVQNRLSACVEETIMLGIGAELALAGRPVDAALARIDARRSVTVIRDHTHQLHGAMGITAEHPLGSLVATMLAWLADTGADRVWTDRACAVIDDEGPWATITGEGNGQ